MDEQKHNPLSAKKSGLKLPKQEVVIVVCMAVLAAIIAVILGEADIIPFNFISLFGWVVSMFGHEIGHAAAGWLFGEPSFPVPMLTLHFEQNTIVHLIVLSGLAALAFWMHVKNNSEAKYAIIALIIFSIALSFTKYYSHIISYMGHGGAIFFGALFLYLSIARAEKYDITRVALFAFIGSIMIFENMYFSYDLITNSSALSGYEKDMPIIGHNDFVKIAKGTDFSVKSLAVLTILNGVIAYAAAIWLAISPPKKH